MTLDEKINLIVDKITEKDKILWIGSKNDFVKLVDVLKQNSTLLTDKDVCQHFVFPDSDEINYLNVKATRSKLRNDWDYNISPFWAYDYKNYSSDEE